MIEYLEENGIKFDIECVIESFICHHNAVTDYIINKLLEQSQEKEFYDINLISTEFCNYDYYPDDIISIISNPEKTKFMMRYLTLSFNSITIPSSVTSIEFSAFF